MNGQDLIRLFKETHDDRVGKYRGCGFVVFLHDAKTGFDALYGDMNTFPREIRQMWMNNKEPSPTIRYLNFFIGVNKQFFHKAFEYAFRLDPDMQIEKIELKEVLESDFGSETDEEFGKHIARYIMRSGIPEECKALLLKRYQHAESVVNNSVNNPQSNF
jgi:hypothetical protein